MTRTCGSCTLCCKTHGVQSISKSPQVWCTHCEIGVGCKIYEKRPHECSAFTCMWLEGFGREEDRPDAIGCVVGVDAAEGLGEFLTIYERHAGVSETLPYVGKFISFAMGRRMVIWIERENAYATILLPHGFEIAPELQEYIDSGNVRAQTYRPLK